MSSSTHQSETKNHETAPKEASMEQSVAKANGNGAPKSPIVSPFALPAGHNCSPIIRDPRGGRGPGVYAVKVTGSMPTGTVLALNDKINLCYVPVNSTLTYFAIGMAGVTGILQDSLATPTVYCTALAGPVATWAMASLANSANMGTMYAATPRAVGASGCAVVQWMPGTMLQIIAAAALTTAAPMTFVLEWSPVYDGGV